jgi:hypothetical protein
LVIGGVALLTALAAAGVWLLGRSAPPPPPPPAADAALEATTAAAPTKPAIDPVGPNPLDATKTLIDAAQRARAWNQDALLAEIVVDVEDGKPKGPLRVRYGAPQGGLEPGSRLGPERVAISYEGNAATQSNERAAKQEVGLPDPNCPLEVAWLKATESGIPRNAALQLRYSSSPTLGRAVWTIRTADEKTTRIVDGSSCAIVVR